MKIKIYTKTKNIKNLDNIPTETVYTSEEHESISKIELNDNILKNKSSLLEHSLTKNLKNKFQAFSFLVDRINKKKFDSILSLGSGLTDIEYFLYLSLSKNKKIIASEFDRNFIKKSNEFFPEFETIEFDLFKDSLLELNQDFDLVYSFGSFYVMDDIQFIRLLKDIRSSGVKEIIDFHSGFMTQREYLKNLIKPFISTFTNLLAKKEKGIYPGKHYGFSRNKNELISLYRQSGWNPVKEIKNLGVHKVAFVLN